MTHPVTVPPIPVDDPTEVLQRYERLQAAVMLPGDETIRLVKRHGWVTMPMDDGFLQPSVRYEDEPDEMENIAALCAQQSHQVLWALTLHDVGAFDELRTTGRQEPCVCFADVPATLAGIRSVAWEFTGISLSWALFPPDLDWVVLSSTREDWWAVMGRADVVEHVTGRPLAEGYRRFEQDAIERRERDWEPLGTFHLQLLATLRDDYPRLAPGQSVAVEAGWADWRPVPLPGDG